MGKHDKDGETFLISSGMDFDSLDTDAMLELEQDDIGALEAAEAPLPLRFVCIPCDSNKTHSGVLVSMNIVEEPRFYDLNDTYHDKIELMASFDVEDIFDFSLQGVLVNAFLSQGANKTKQLVDRSPFFSLKETRIWVKSFTYEASSVIVKFLVCNTYLKECKGE